MSKEQFFFLNAEDEETRLLAEMEMLEAQLNEAYDNYQEFLNVKEGMKEILVKQAR